jgi:3-dehydroquinate synthase
MAVIPVDIAGRPYEVRVGAGLLAELAPNCRGKLRTRGVRRHQRLLAASPRAKAG